MSELADILRRIVEQRRIRIDQTLASSRDHGLFEWAETPAPRPPVSFVESLKSSTGRAIIAEVKLGSPRLGSLESQLNPERQARLYADNGAAALSVVVEPDFFYGSYELLARCREASGLPALAKDFVVHPVQIEWARQAGAAAILLIAALHTSDELVELADRARRLGLEPLVECHTRSDLARLDAGRWELVGVNNRDLRTFEVDLRHSIEMVPDLPAGCLKIAESGLRSAADVQSLVAAGFDAFLIGEALLLAENPGAELRQLVGSEESR